MQPLAPTLTLTAGEAVMAWRRRGAQPQTSHLPDAQNVLARLDAVVDRLEGAYEQIQRVVPMVEEYAATLPRRGRESGGDRA